jgi:hypothetical protein
MAVHFLRFHSGKTIEMWGCGQPGPQITRMRRELILSKCFELFLQLKPLRITQDNGRLGLPFGD